MSRHEKLMALGEIMVTRNGSVDPKKHPQELFDLYSIPAYDLGLPDIVKGNEIGSAKQIVQPNDVLISKIVPHIRRAWIVGGDHGRRIIASGEWIVFRSEKVNPNYLRHVLLGDDFHFQFMQTVSGVGGSLLRARPSHVVKIKVPLPSLSEQRRIAAILDQAEALRAKRREALRKLEGLAQAVFVEMFGDPVSNPKGWPLAKLGKVGSLDRGVSKHRPRNAPELLGGPYPLIQTGDVANSEGYLTKFNSTYSEFGLKQSKLWPAGTLCITIAANIAKTGILTFDACFPDSVVGFSSADPSTIEYIRVWLSFLQKTLEESAPESAQKNINLEILRNLKVPEPPIALQQKFACQMQRIFRLKSTYKTSLGKFEDLFVSLQQRAFRGEL